jgi:predicted phage terminase large subunit-like protein
VQIDAGKGATNVMTGDANDYSVCTTWWIIKADYYLVDVFRARLQYPDLRRMIASLAAKHGASTTLIENAGPGMAVLQDFWRDPAPGMPRPIGRKPEGSKVDRMVAQSAKIEAGHIHLPKEADWLAPSCMSFWRFQPADMTIRSTVSHSS